MAGRRVDVRAILADPELRRELLVPTIQATQAREGIETTREQAERAYYVVTEAEKTAFFDLGAARRAGGGSEDRREESFALALGDDLEHVRFDVARRDFRAIEGSPLAFRRVGLIAHVFKESPSLDPTGATVKQGLATADDERWLREFWEVPRTSIGQGATWVPLNKGGEFSRFYYDYHLVIRWANNGRELKDYVIAREGSESKRIYSQDWYFMSGLTWPLAASALNVRRLPAGCIFSHKGPAVFPRSAADADFQSGVLNSIAAEYILQSLTSREAMGGRWEVGVVKRLPLPAGTRAQRTSIGDLSREIHDAKERWDRGNEVSTHFTEPWLLEDSRAGEKSSLAAGLDRLAERESSEEARIQRLYADLNDEVYRLYGISDSTRAIIEETLGERPPEVLWPRMEGKTPDQKRMEHVFRLLSYAVKRVVEADDDGVLSFYPAAGEPPLVERVRHELTSLFPGRDPNELEIEIVNELKRSVKGYRKTQSLAEWLENAFFDYHAGLYRNRPIFWHIASAQGTARFAFGALVHYHRFGKNGMKKLRATYVRDVIDTRKREAALADKEGRGEDRIELQAQVEEIQALDEKLRKIQEGHHESPEGGERDYRILTPWKTPEARPKGWDPDIDDGVKVNISPLEKAGVLRIAKVT